MLKNVVTYPGALGEKKRKCMMRKKHLENLNNKTNNNNNYNNNNVRNKVVNGYTMTMFN